MAVPPSQVTASEEGTLTDSLLAKLLKYKMIRMRDAEIEKRNAKVRISTV